MRRPPRNQELEAAIVADPESADAYLVYGDWLQEQGEALGELVSVQAAIAKQSSESTTTTTNAKRLAHREKTLLAENARGWLGYFAKYQHTWRFGFLESLILTEPGREDFIELLDLVAARFLRDLELEVLGHRVFENSELISAIGELGLPPILRKLALVASSSDPRSVDVGTMRVLWPRLARIKELSIGAGKMELGAIDLPEVETVALTTNSTPATIAALTNARWPKLRSFSLAFTAYPYEPVDPESLEPLIIALAPMPLTHLGLSGSWSGDALLDRLLAPPQAQQLARLNTLSLSRSALTDEAAQSILKNQARLDHFASIDLRENYFTKPTCEALSKAFGKKLNVADQGNADAYAGYGEDEEPYDDDNVVAPAEEETATDDDE